MLRCFLYFSLFFVTNPTIAFLGYEHVITQSLQKKTLGDLLVGKQNTKSKITMFGVNLNTVYFSSQLGWQTSTKDSPLPDTLDASSLSENDLAHIASLVKQPEAFVKTMDDTILTSMYHTIAADNIHKANLLLGASPCKTFEKNTILSMRVGEEKCYTRVSTLTPKLELLPLAGLFNCFESVFPDWEDTKTLWLSAYIEIIRQYEIKLQRNYNNELSVTFSLKYSIEPNAECALDVYCMDINEEGRNDGTAFGFAYASLYAGIKPSYKHSATFAIHQENESAFIDDFLNGKLNTRKIIDCTKSAFTLSSPEETSNSVQETSTDKAFSTKKSGKVSFYLGTELSGGVGIASERCTLIKDKIKTEGWFWPAIDGNISANIFKYSERTNEHSTTSFFEGISDIALNGTINMSTVVAFNILDIFRKGHPEKGQDFWLLLHPLEIENSASHIIAFQKKHITPDPQLGDVENATAFYNIELSVSKHDLKILNQALANAGVSNRETRNIICSTICSDTSGSQSLVLEYTANPNGRELARILSSDYKLSEVLFYNKQSATAAPFGLRTDINLKIPLLGQEDIGIVTFKSLRGQVKVLENDVELNIAGSQERLKKEPSLPQSNSGNARQRKTKDYNKPLKKAYPPLLNL